MGFLAPLFIFGLSSGTEVIPPTVLTGGGYRTYYDVSTLGWGAIRAYPQVIFDFVLETLPPAPALVPEVAPVVENQMERRTRFVEAAAAFDLDLVRKYLAAAGIALTD